MNKSANALKAPPKEEATVQRASACPLSPFLVNALPSIAVGADAGVPGIPSKIAGIDPPYTPPQYSPDNNNIALAGSNTYENGINTATAIVAENPGNAPNIIPANNPPIHRSRLNG